MTPQDIMRVSDQIKPILAQHDSALQGAVLADLTAFWLAGHLNEDPRQTAQIRETLLSGFMQMVRRVLPLADQMVRGHLKDLRRPPR